MIELLKTFFFLFAVIDPLGSIPVFLEATREMDNKTKKKVAIKATFIASLILLFFIIIGQVIMETMHITLSAFQISGGVILFLFALTMVFGNKNIEENKNLIKDYKHVTIFPIAIPSIASPGAIMAVVLLTDNNTFTFIQQLETTGLVMLVMVTTAIMLLAARKVQEKVGEAGIMVITKIMGLILASFAVQSILTGIKEYFKL
ncbi:MAG: MarC family protein [Chitinophagaceae bacterium]|nr:MarC family protein [Chitinophagaceae bacterium]